jgi:hypothetical protein
MKHLRKLTDKDKRLTLAQFWRFQSMINWPCGFGPRVRQHIMTGTYGHGTKKERRWPGFLNSLPGYAPSDLKTSH